MRLVFEKFETPLPLRRDALNVLRIEDPSLYARCALSLAQGFPPEALEPAYFFSEDGGEVKPSKVLHFAGDPLFLDLNDRRIVSQVVKLLVERVMLDPGIVQALEKMNYEMESVFENQMLQMVGGLSIRGGVGRGEVPEDGRLRCGRRRRCDHPSKSYALRASDGRFVPR